VAERPAIPAQLKREVLVEAHHRCAICREPSFEVAHIEPWSKVKAHSFDNLIALCPNCHHRHHRGEIDKASLRMYKANLSILNGRYGDVERRVLEAFAEYPDATHVELANADIHLLYLLKDGLLAKAPSGAVLRAMGAVISPQRYVLTPKGREFVQRWISGQDLGPPPSSPSSA
jgi:hypothetical protein